MIVTVTLNPSLDRTLDIDALSRAEVIRAHCTHLDPGGKGVNVSRALVANGARSRAIIPYGGSQGAQLVRLLEAEDVELVTVPIAGATRCNVALVETDGTVTKINESGPDLSAAELEAVTQAVLRVVTTADWVVVSGRVPPGVSTADFARLCGRLLDSGIRLAVDTSGPELRAAAEAGATALKPNRQELAEAVGTDLTTVEDVCAAAGVLRGWGAGTVLASLGAEGAVLADANGILIGQPPKVTPRSSVGAGDAMLAGFLSRNANGREALIEALAWGAAAAGLPGSRMPRPADLDRQGVRVQPGPPIIDSGLITALPTAHPGHGPLTRSVQCRLTTPRQCKEPASKHVFNASAAISPRWSCPISAHSSPGASSPRCSWRPAGCPMSTSPN